MGGFALSSPPSSCFWFGSKSTQVDYNAVAQSIADVLECNPEYDDGSYGPLFVRLAWHASGTYSKTDGSGGSNGGCMRFTPESAWGANAGLGIARALLEKVKAKHPGISYADLYTLSGVVSIQAMGGPVIPWRPGRTDHGDGKASPPDGRLPDATKKADHLRDIFYRMGFGDKDIVALSGAHSLGRCHKDRSGFSGPWTFAPTTFSNEYFRLLLSEKWKENKPTPSAPLQYADSATGTLMMLPSDLALTADPKFKPFVEAYAKDGEAFKKDFAVAFSKLLELGVNFPPDSKPIHVSFK